MPSYFDGKSPSGRSAFMHLKQHIIIGQKRRILGKSLTFKDSTTDWLPGSAARSNPGVDPFFQYIERHRTALQDHVMKPAHRELFAQRFLRTFAKF